MQIEAKLEEEDRKIGGDLLISLRAVNDNLGLVGRGGWVETNRCLNTGFDHFEAFPPSSAVESSRPVMKL